jgi:hypothetical protein
MGYFSGDSQGEAEEEPSKSNIWPNISKTIEFDFTLYLYVDVPFSDSFVCSGLFADIRRI